MKSTATLSKAMLVAIGLVSLFIIHATAARTGPNLNGNYCTSIVSDVILYIQLHALDILTLFAQICRPSIAGVTMALRKI